MVERYILAGASGILLGAVLLAFHRYKLNGQFRALELPLYVCAGITILGLVVHYRMSIGWFHLAGLGIPLCYGLGWRISQHWFRPFRDVWRALVAGVLGGFVLALLGWVVLPWDDWADESWRLAELMNEAAANWAYGWQRQLLWESTIVMLFLGLITFLCCHFLTCPLIRTRRMKKWMIVAIVVSSLAFGHWFLSGLLLRGAPAMCCRHPSLLRYLLLTRPAAARLRTRWCNEQRIPYEDATLMHIATLTKAKTLKLLHGAGADINARTDNGDTPLHFAAKCRDLGNVGITIGASGNINARNEDGETPLFSAVAAGNIEVVRALIRAGADLRVGDRWGATPLFWAVSITAVTDNRAAVLELLLAAGADVRKISRNGETALHRAPDGEIVARLLTAGADIEAQDAKKWRPLMTAAAEGRAGVVRALLHAGADINARAHDGRTALQIAQESLDSDRLDVYWRSRIGECVEVLRASQSRKCQTY